MVLNCKDRKQRFLLRNLELHILNRMAKQFQLRSLVQLDRSLVHMLLWKRACPSDGQACPSSEQGLVGVEHSLVLHKDRTKRSLRRSLVPQNLNRMVQPFRLHMMVQRRNPNRMAMPFRLRTMVQHRNPKPFQLRTMGQLRKYRSTSS